MKRQLDRLKGKRLVTGDPNLMTKDEICINATPNGVEVKEIGTDGKIKDLAGNGGEGGDSEEIWYEVINPITYHKLSDLLGSDIVVFITGISGFIPNVNFLGINLPSDMVTSETVISYFNIKGFLYAPDINFEGTYNSIEDLVYLLFKRTGTMNDDEIIDFLNTFYTNFKKVTYSMVLEKFKSLIPA